MSIKVGFRNAQLLGMTLAKVGNPQRDEPLQTSKALCEVTAADAELLTLCFLKPFKSLELHQFDHPGGVDKNVVFDLASQIFEDNQSLLKNGTLIAEHLYAETNHPNIKDGDLCVSLLEQLQVGSEEVQAISIIKSESQVPFLQIASVKGDLTLKTQKGIYPDKVDKGCLIVNHQKEEGFVVYLFDKNRDTQFWIQDFLSARPVKNEDYLTRRYSELCLAFSEQGLPEETETEERMKVANDTLSFLSETEKFSVDEFQSVALEDQELIEQFSSFKSDYEESAGVQLEDQFTVSKKEAQRAQKKLKGKLKLDSGVEMKFTSGFISESEKFLERGFDKKKHMKYVKVYFHNEM